MKIDEYARLYKDKMRRLEEFTRGDDIKDILGTEAVNHFKGSFQNEGFTDEVLNPWKDVKRRDPSSPWYGHSGQRGKFSNARTTAKILSGETRELQNAITYRRITNGVRVVNDKPYASVHQYGGRAKIYGKKEFQMTPRPFMGRSAVLVRNINDKIRREMTRIIKD
ncbi:MAG: phage virion morphogenesis protein [Bacteroidota bacterium]|jgi:phage gpG-like protein|nr:phage virion morphogenesis protein [Bacteroidota bacterium]HHU96844.1 virion morphogenesis protein [Petrimonas sp.]